VRRDPSESDEHDQEPMPRELRKDPSSCCSSAANRTTMTPPNSSPPDFADAEDDRRLEQLLREAAPACIDDAGFSTRVLGALLPTRRQASARRLALIGAGTVLGVATATLLGGSQIAHSANQLTVLIATWSELPLSFGGVSASLGATASVLAVCVFAFGVRRSGRN
jgi:hypothetical protein